MKQIPYGITDFSRIQKENYYYVDKTGLIEKTNAVLNTRQKFICVSRPRRFGKSMAADMLAAYYDRGENSASLFSSLKIHYVSSYQQHLNQYDVIKVNMQEFLSQSSGIEGMLELLRKSLLWDLLEEYPDFMIYKWIIIDNRSKNRQLLQINWLLY